MWRRKLSRYIQIVCTYFFSQVWTVRFQIVEIEEHRTRILETGNPGVSVHLVFKESFVNLVKVPMFYIEISNLSKMFVNIERQLRSQQPYPFSSCSKHNVSSMGKKNLLQNIIIFRSTLRFWPGSLNFFKLAMILSPIMFWPSFTLRWKMVSRAFRKEVHCFGVQFFVFCKNRGELNS